MKKNKNREHSHTSHFVIGFIGGAIYMLIFITVYAAPFILDYTYQQGRVYQAEQAKLNCMKTTHVSYTKWCIDNAYGELHE